MKIDKKTKIQISLFASAIIIFSLYNYFIVREPKVFNDFTVSNFLSDCKSHEGLSVKSYSDTHSRFRINFPENWLVEVGDSSKLTALDTLAFISQSKVNSIAISMHQSSLTIDTYFRDELKTMIKELDIIEVGFHSINGLHG